MILAIKIFQMGDEEPYISHLLEPNADFLGSCGRKVEVVSQCMTQALFLYSSLNLNHIVYYEFL